MNYLYGRYALACTWLAKIFGEEAGKISNEFLAESAGMQDFALLGKIRKIAEQVCWNKYEEDYLMQEQKLERITPAQAGLDPQCIINMMDRMEKEHINITSFMLLRHGKVLCEASYEPYDAAQLRTVYSLSKTFTSMAVGIAAGEGKIDLDEKITDLFAAEIENGKIQVGKELASLSLRHLLRM